MSFNMPTGPVAHMGIAAAIAYLLRLNVFVTAFCAILPDILDKSLSSFFGIGWGRHIGHTLLFIVVVAILFSIKDRRYGLAALLGGASHLIIDHFDSNGFVPWDYPFVHYDLPHRDFSFIDYLNDYVTLSDLGTELMTVSLTALIVLLIIWFYQKYLALKRRGRKTKKSVDNKKALLK